MIRIKSLLESFVQNGKIFSFRLGLVNSEIDLEKMKCLCCVCWLESFNFHQINHPCYVSFSYSVNQSGWAKRQVFFDDVVQNVLCVGN